MTNGKLRPYETAFDSMCEEDAHECGDPAFQADFIDPKWYHRKHPHPGLQQLQLPLPSGCEALIPGTPDE